MPRRLKSLLLAAVLATGIAAACAVVRSAAPEAERSAAPAPAADAAAAPPPAPAAEAVPDPIAAPGAARIDFETEIRPLLEGCRPCHFEGGKMYARLPFDDPQTIRRLGEKLFTRIKEEEAQRRIRAFVDPAR